MKMSCENSAIMRGACALACVAALALTAGCLTAPNIERTRHYTLFPPIEVASASAIDLTLGVRPLFSARPYNLPMAFLGDDHRLGFREHEQWAELPATSMTRTLTDALAATNRFKDVGNAADMARPDLHLTGELRMFHENRTVAPYTAEIEVRFELRPSREPGALWTETLRESVPLESEDADAFAAAMNEAMARLAMRAANAIAKIEAPKISATATGIFTSPGAASRRRP